jgi:hypothetical protein
MFSIIFKIISILLISLSLKNEVSKAKGASKPEGDSSSQNPTDSKMTQPYVPNQVLVSLKKIMSESDRALIWKKFNLKEIEKVGSEALYLLEAQSKTKVDIRKLTEEIEKNPNVKYAEPNMIQKTFSTGS